MDRMITLSVGTCGAEQWMHSFQDLSELAVNLGESHDYVNVVSSVISDEREEDAEEYLRHDENTLLKVITAINAGVPDLSSEEVTNIVNQIQNAGILFRERVR